MTGFSSECQALTWPFLLSHPVWFKDQVTVDDDPHRETRPDRQRWLDVEIALNDVLAGPAHAVDLGALTRKVVALAEDDARAHGVSVRFEAASVPPITIDALQVEQTLINVINNAIDAAAEASRSPGSVTVRVAAIDKGARIEIEDNGPGVSEVVAKHLFEPFVTTKPGGMGLGLALSRELIGAHGGTIDWERIRPDGGARFTIELPLSPEMGHGA